MSLCFKENCSDSRNTGVMDIIHGFNELNCNVEVYDPWVSQKKARFENGISLLKKLKKNRYDAILLTVSHDEFKSMGVEVIRSFGKNDHVLFDVKYIFPFELVDGRL